MRRSPNERASKGKKEITRVRRKYKTNLTKMKKFIPGEEDHVVNMILVLKLGGYPNTQVGQIVGLGRNQVAEILKQPKVAEELIALRAALPQAALDLLEGYSIEAVVTIADIMRTGNDDKIVLAAATEILDRVGIGKVSKRESTNVNEERTTFVDDGIVERLREASPEVQEKAAQLIEGLEELLSDHADVVVTGEDEDEPD
jgi:hypothetical protein